MLFIILLLPLILILKRFKNFYFVFIPWRIGAYLALEPFIRENENNLAKKNVSIFCYLEKPTANEFLAELYIKRMKATKNIKFVKSNRFNKLLWKYIYDVDELLFKKKTKLFLQMGVRKKYNIFAHGTSIISMPDRENKKALESLSYLGFNKNSKWICIHNRDSGYLNWLEPNRDWRYHNYRDWPIDDMQLALEYFVKKGYYVIRIGKKTNQQMKTNNPKIIDFINHKERNDLNETFLISNCEFYFGSNCGAYAVPIIFRKPVFIINTCPIEGIFDFLRNYPRIFKRVFDLEKEKILTIREMADRNLFHLFKTEDYKEKKIKLINNTPSEILSFAIEAERRVNKTWTSNKGYEENYLKFLKEISRDLLLKNRHYKNLIGHEFLKNTEIY